MASQDRPEFSIVMPAHNETRDVRITLSDIVNYFSAAVGESNFEVLVVTDGPNDETRNLVARVAEEMPVIRHLHVANNLGKGEAIKRGMQSARGRRIALADADGSAAPAELCRLLKLTDSADAAIGSRWVNGSSIGKSQSVARRFASRGFNGLVRLLLQIPIRDTQCGYKAFRATSLQKILPQVSVGDYSFDVDLLWKLYSNGFTLLEVPLRWSDTDGSSVRLRRVVPMMGMTLVGLRLANSRVGSLLGPERFVRIYGLLQRFGH